MLECGEPFLWVRICGFYHHAGGACSVESIHGKAHTSLKLLYQDVGEVCDPDYLTKLGLNGRRLLITSPEGLHSVSGPSRRRIGNSRCCLSLAPLEIGYNIANRRSRISFNLFDPFQPLIRLKVRFNAIDLSWHSATDSSGGSIL